MENRHVDEIVRYITKEERLSQEAEWQDSLRGIVYKNLMNMGKEDSDKSLYVLREIHEDIKKRNDRIKYHSKGWLMF